MQEPPNEKIVAQKHRASRRDRNIWGAFYYGFGGFGGEM